MHLVGTIVARLETISIRLKMKNVVRSAIAATAFVACAANAIPIASAGTDGVKAIVASTGQVVATYLGSSAWYNSTLYLNGQSIFNNKATPIGTVFDLGYYVAGTELNFLLAVSDTHMGYFTGAASKNADKHTHARVQADWDTPGTALVSFEDLWGGTFNYNDLSFSFETVGPSLFATSFQVPEPGTWELLATGLICAVIARRRRNL